MPDPHPIQRLLTIMGELRHPESGCPWDRRQTFGSVAPYTLEEAFEVADAIERGDLGDLRDELGDLLFQVVFHARMAEEAGKFDFADVVHGICAKMVRRHPHVYPVPGEAPPTDLHQAWEAAKQQERLAKAGRASASLLDGVTLGLPALSRAEKLQKRAARVGFDWQRADEVLDKVQEELQECRAALAQSAPVEELEWEIGDLLFSCVNLARHLGVDAEQALRRANRRFTSRFQFMEQVLAERGQSPGPESRILMEALWEAAKAAESQDG